MSDATPVPGGTTTVPPRVLVVDDEEAVRAFIVETLRMTGLHVDMASDGLEAVTRLVEHRYDLIVSDLRMPRLDGVGVYREVERRWPGDGRRVLFVTGSTVLGEYELFFEEVRPTVLKKPFGLDALQATVRQMLGQAVTE